MELRISTESGEKIYHLTFEYSGAETMAKISDENGPVVAGIATCHQSDNFSKVVGRKVALDYAILNTFPREVRKQIWEQYRKRCRV